MGYNFIQIFTISALASLILFVLFMMIFGVKKMSQMKLQQQQENLLQQSLEVGKTVVINNGIVGKLLEINDDLLKVEIDSQCVVLVKRFSITEIL